MKQRTITFSPPDITESEIEEVCKALRSGWITKSIGSGVTTNLT